jgi:hypothetical protein
MQIDAHFLQSNVLADRQRVRDCAATESLCKDMLTIGSTPTGRVIASAIGRASGQPESVLGDHDVVH